MKLSARNQMKGTVTNVEKGVITSRVSIRIEAPATITAAITREAAEELNLKVGDRVQAIIKATEVIIGK
ncbi:MAG: TOBE domain-containing protein [Candidatus Freyarchaeota archaeon]|nr:TOBE domain-containing protein [Candidatus Jordarchaeia archaeon]MBS7270283.1 TOBE domain-containing protein [Candidatus Jordarchaeia archaeon]MBS7281051.1 TOBE domain-containing protein [Candidatus Jordarchaeia archaeon]